MEHLKGGREALTAALAADIEALGEDAVEPLLAMAGSQALLIAPEPEGWAPIHAVRLLVRMRVFAAIPVLLRIMEGAEEDDLASAEASHALRVLGLASLPSLARFVERAQNPVGLGLALEAVATLRGDHLGDEPFDEVRQALERRVLATADSAERTSLIGYLGDLGSAQSIDPLMQVLDLPSLTALEYERLRDVLEHLGARCPDVYFDASGRGYPLDDEKVPHCPSCAVTMRFGAYGDLLHPEPVCAGGERPPQ